MQHSIIQFGQVYIVNASSLRKARSFANGWIRQKEGEYSTTRQEQPFEFKAKVLTKRLLTNGNQKRVFIYTTEPDLFSMGSSSYKNAYDAFTHLQKQQQKFIVLNTFFPLDSFQTLVNIHKGASATSQGNFSDANRIRQQLTRMRETATVLEDEF